MPDETVQLARNAAALREENLPKAVVACAKDAIIDTIAACICGAALPWSRIVIDYAERTGPGGNSRILGRGSAVQAPAAALANGALAHAFELDSLTRPGAGAHPGATVLPPALAIAQQGGGVSGKALIAAFVAGNEVMIRIGRATGHTNEARGFHAPGTTGLKRYPVHATAHAAVRAVRDLQAAHGFAGSDVEGVTVTGSTRMIERHAIAEPADLMLAQYSIPFCVALALFREARDPESYDESALDDPQIRALTRRVKLVPESGGGGGHGGAMGSTVTLVLADGRHFERHVESGLLEPGELPDKFTRLCRGALGETGAARLYDRLQLLEDEASLDWLGQQV